MRHGRIATVCSHCCCEGLGEMTMEIQVIQCSQCGAPLPATEIGDVVSCGSCGATLRVQAGSSGFPMASLAETDINLELPAKVQAAERLVEQIEKLENQAVIDREENVASGQYRTGDSTRCSRYCTIPSWRGVARCSRSTHGCSWWRPAPWLSWPLAIPRSLHKAANSSPC